MSDASQRINSKMGFDDFVGNENAVTRLRLLVDDAKEVGILPHIGLFGPAGHGKSQPIDSLVLTPEGYVLMGNIKPVDLVCTPNGEIAYVREVYPQGKIDVYEIIFSDGTSTECSKDHLWFTETYLDRGSKRSGSVKTTEEIFKTLLYGGKRNHSIPQTKPIFFFEESLPIEPYVVGCLLGDGYLPNKGCVSLSSKDDEIISTFNSLLGEDFVLNRTTQFGNDYRIIKSQKGGPKKNIIKEHLKLMGLLGKKSNNKFIPNKYLYSSVQSRIELLRGLMDTDGTVKVNVKNVPSSQVSYSSTSIKLAEGVKFLIESLGGIAKISSRYTRFTYKGIKKTGQKSYRVSISMPNNINPFKLKRKAEKVYYRTKYNPIRFIDSIRFIGKKECQCISIANSSGLYITNNCIVTHNTTLSDIIAGEVDRRFVYINSVAVKTSMVLRGIITHPDNMVHGAIICLDECHRLPKAIQDNMLSVLDEPSILVTSYKDQIIRDKLPNHITFILSTTHQGLLNDPLISRMECIELHEYSIIEKQTIAVKYLHRAHKLKGEQFNTDAILEIGRRARSGRHVIKICDNVIRFMRVKKLTKITPEVVENVFDLLGINQNSLTKRDMRLLHYLAQTGACGLETLEAYLNMPRRDIKEKIEPWLLRRQLIIRSSGGRTITNKGMAALRGEKVNV